MTPDSLPPVLSLARVPAVQVAGGTALALGAREGALLAWLALEGPTPRSRMAQLLWPDSAPDAARNALRQRLFQLRRLVRVELVVGTHTLSLAPGVEHDLLDADGVLSESKPAIGAEFDAWLAQQRERRHDRLCRSLAELSSLAEAAHDHADALSHANELLALQPLSEEAHRRVMRLHYLAGDRAAALQAFDRCEQVLKHEVGAAPAPETLALLRHVEAAVPGDAGLQPHVLPASLLRPPRAIGRDSERNALLAAWNAGQPFVLLGESGMGKSRLLDSLADAWPGTLVVGARPGDPLTPLALVSRLVDVLCTRRPGLMRLDAARELRDLSTQGPQASGSRPAPRSWQNALLSLLTHALADTAPLALVLDDWQFADEASVDLLQEVLAAPALHALRVGHASRTLAGALAEARVAALGRHGAVRQVVLAPLGLHNVSELVATLQLPGADALPLAHALLARVGGNPLHILETLRHMLEARIPVQAERVAAPGQVKQLVAARLKHLSDSARQLLRVAAVAGTDFGAELAEAVSGRGALDLCDDWSLLEHMGMFDSCGIAHDLYAEAVLDTLPTPIGRLVHARVAHWLEPRAHEPARLAAHWQAAGEPTQALPHLLAAARKAWVAARAPETLGFFRHAAEIEVARGQPDTAFAHWFDCAEALTEIGSPEQVAQCLRALQAQAHTDPQRLRLSLVEAVHRYMSGEVEEGLSRVIALLSDAIAQGDVRVECECRFAIANRAVADGRFDEGLQHLAAGERLLRQAGDNRRANSLVGSMAMVFGMRGQSRLSIREHERVLPQLAQEGDRATWVVACTAKALAHIRLGDADTAQADVARAMAEAARVSIAPPDTIVSLRNVVDTLRWCGRFDEALRLSDEFAHRLAAQGVFTRACEPAAQLYLHLGRADLARPLLNTLSQEPFARLRERLRVGLLAVQDKLISEAAGRGDWPAEAVAVDDLALAIEWALWSGLQDESPWPVQALLDLARRCHQAELKLFERPLRSLVARRLLEAGDADQAQAFLPPAQPYAALAGLHGATPWAALFGSQALALAGHAEAAACAQGGAEWLLRVAGDCMPAAFRDSFLHRSPVNRALLARAAQTRPR